MSIKLLLPQHMGQGSKVHVLLSFWWLLTSGVMLGSRRARMADRAVLGPYTQQDVAAA